MRKWKPEPEDTGTMEIFCERCGQERSQTFRREVSTFNRRTFIETTYHCPWCGGHRKVEGTSKKRAILGPSSEEEFDFG
jgi:uncharacterized protein CbrC (UPF0167 family)